MANEDRKLDELLDGALADYSNIEPRAGLEGRIVARLSASDSTRAPYAWLRFCSQWGIACAVVFGILAMTLWRMKPPQTQVAVTRAIPPSATIPKVHVLVRKPAPAPRSHHRAAQTSATAPQRIIAVKQETFPAPSPLTDQERLLFAYVRKTPVQEIAANAKPDPLPALEQQINQVLPLQKNADSNSNTR